MNSKGRFFSKYHAYSKHTKIINQIESSRDYYSWCRPNKQLLCFDNKDDDDDDDIDNNYKHNPNNHSHDKEGNKQEDHNKEDQSLWIFVLTYFFRFKLFLACDLKFLYIQVYYLVQTMKYLKYLK